MLKDTLHQPTVSKLQNIDGNKSQSRLSHQIKWIVKLQIYFQFANANQIWYGQMWYKARIKFD